MSSPQATSYGVSFDEISRPMVAYVFYPGDLLSQQTKDRNPGWIDGGIVESEFVTLKYCQGYIRRCEITELRVQMEGENKSFINPTERKHMQKTYTIVDESGNKKRIGMKTRRNFETLEVEEVHDGILRTPLYPADDVAILIGKTKGFVQMPCRSAQERAVAQEFLFPNGTHVVAPRSIAKLKEYFQSKFAQAQNSFEQAVAQAAIRSCDSFRSEGERVCNEANSEMQKARAKGHPFVYGDNAVAYFEQLGLPRQDNLDRQQQGNNDRLESALAQMAELTTKLISNREAPPAAEPPVAKTPAVTAPVVEGLPVIVEEPTASVSALINKGTKKNG